MLWAGLEKKMRGENMNKKKITWWQLTEEKSTCGFNGTALCLLPSKERLINAKYTIIQVCWETDPPRAVTTWGPWRHRQDGGGVDLVRGRCGCRRSVCCSFYVQMRSCGGAAEAERLPTGSGALHSTQKEVWEVNILFFPFLLENILFYSFISCYLI